MVIQLISFFTCNALPTELHAHPILLPERDQHQLLKTVTGGWVGGGGGGEGSAIWTVRTGG